MKVKKLAIFLGLIIILLAASVFVVGNYQFAEAIASAVNYEQVQADSEIAIPEDATGLSILNPHSSPKAGDSWIVSFKTKGKADLIIAPIGQATIDDLDFVSLKCGDDEINPQILENDIIFYPDWSCDETEQVNHLVNVRGKHTLEFQFGEEIVYAYNSPDTKLLRPNAAGDETNFASQSPATGEHWDKVNDTTPDEGASLIWFDGESGNPYYLDLFHLNDTSTGGTINKITLYVRTQHPYYAVYFYHAIKTGGIVYNGSLVTVTGQTSGNNYETYSYDWTTNPDTDSAWTWGEIDSLQVGVNHSSWWLASDNFGTARVTQVYLEVDYTPCSFTLRIYDPTGTEIITRPQQSIEPIDCIACDNTVINSSSAYVRCQMGGEYNATITIDSCAGSHSAVAKQIILNCTSPTTNKFIIRNLTGGDIATIDEQGYMYIVGKNYANQASLNPQPGDFAVKGSDGSYVAYINKSNGALNLKGSLEEGQINLNPPIGSFIVRNSSNDYVAYINNDGDLKLTGWIYEKWLGSLDCYADGDVKTTDYGDNLYNCVGSDKRCFNGACGTCEGFLYADGLGETRCWYNANAAGDSCTIACSTHGGTQGTCQENDDTSCTVCKNFYPAETICEDWEIDTYAYGSFFDTMAPFLTEGWGTRSGCRYRSAGVEGYSCDYAHEPHANILTRFCVCNY